MSDLDFDRSVQAVRRFNRFYTKQIGVLQEGLLKSPFSLAEVRVLYEVAHRAQPTAKELAGDLGLDAGYLSRILRGFRTRGLISVRTSKADARQGLIGLTRKGQAAFAALNARSSHEIGTMLRRLEAEQQTTLVDAMQTIEDLLGAPPERTVSYLLRLPQPGDMGWIVHRHGVLYAQEWGYDETFEALVAEIVAKFVQHFDAKRERCWIAEKDGQIAGSAFIVRKSATVAKLRLMLVEPAARGLGIGARLVDECIRFARQVGYRKMTLWTQSELVAARRLYARAGFRLVHEQPHHSFGKDLVAEIWDLKL